MIQLGSKGMKRTIFLTIAIIGLALVAQAQTDSLAKVIGMDKNTVIRDSSGKVIAYKDLKKMILSGKNTVLRINKSIKTDSAASTSPQLADQSEESMMAALPKPTETKFFKTGEKISSFVADDINGTGLKLKKLQGKIVVLNFWFIGCPPCRLEMPELNKLALAYANDPDVVFISIGLDDRYDIKNFIKYSPLAYHIVDNGRMYADMYRINLYPTNVVLDKEGKVRFHASGYFANLPYWLKKTIDENK